MSKPLINSASNSDSFEIIKAEVDAAEEFVNNDFLEAIKRFENLLTRIENLNYDKHDADYKFTYTTILTHLSNVHYYSSKYDKALHYTDMLLAAAEYYNDKHLRGNACIQYANISSDIGKYAEAMKFNLQALEILKELGNTEGMGSTYNNIGNVFLFQKDYAQALPHYEKAIELSNKIGQRMNASNAMLNIASIYVETEEPDKAMLYLQDGVKIKEEIGDEFGVAAGRFLMGDINLEKNNFSEALKCYKESLEIQTKLDDMNGIFYSNMKLGVTLSYEYKAKKDKKLLEEAEKYLLTALEWAGKVKSKYCYSLIYENLCEFYELKDDIQTAHEYLKKLRGLEKELYNKNVSDEVLRLEKELQVKEAKHIAEMNQVKNVELAETISKLEELDKQKNELFGIVVHDLKNPIGNIKLLGEFLLNEENYSKAEIKEYKQFIVDSANTSLDLVEQLLDYAAIEQGKIVLNIVEFDINAEMERIIRLYGMKTSQKSILVKYKNELKNNIVKTDRNAIVQIVDNLFSNAIKFSPSDKNIFVTLSNEDNFIRIEIKDEGAGFTESDRKKLFKQFSKLSARPTAGEHSSGLGLSIVKKLTDSLKGTIECVSKQGEGATMIVKVPVN